MPKVDVAGRSIKEAARVAKLAHLLAAMSDLLKPPESSAWRGWPPGPGRGAGAGVERAGLARAPSHVRLRLSSRALL